MGPASRSTRSVRSSARRPERCASACTGFSNSYDGGIPMATDQLERDLKTLAEPQPDDDDLRLAIRATLREQLEARPDFRGRRRLLFGSAAVTAVTLGAAIVAVVATGGSGGAASANAAILANVLRASSPPPNMIVHVKEAGVVPGGTKVTAEWWQETNRPYALRLIKG